MRHLDIAVFVVFIVSFVGKQLTALLNANGYEEGSGKQKMSKDDVISPSFPYKLSFSAQLTPTI